MLAAVVLLVEGATEEADVVRTSDISCARPTSTAVLPCNNKRNKMRTITTKTILTQVKAGKAPASHAPQ